MDVGIVTYSYADACRNIFNTIRTSGQSSLEKYTSQFIRKGYEYVKFYDLYVNSLLVILFLNELQLIYLHTIIHSVSSQLNVFNFCYLTLIFLFNINRFFADND